MSTSRREFIKVTAAATVLGGSEASAQVIQGIAIVSSIGFVGTRHQQDFMAGLNIPNLPAPSIEDNLGYSFQALSTAAGEFDNDSSIGLVITCGGLIAWNAAMNSLTNKSFISLIGGTPGNFPTNAQNKFIGCVNLNTYGADGMRISYLIKNGINSKTDICLLYNPNSLMATAEIATSNWGGATPVPATNGLGDPTKFSLDFNNISQHGVVISADPYFFHQREQLIAAANASGKSICYPLFSFRNIGGVNRPTRGRSFAIGPDLYGVNGGYYMLGQMAKQYLNSGTVSPFMQYPAQSSINL
jgi:hypothetical protein